jgi:hypothetical protein
MTARSIRRAAERKAKKLARKAERSAASLAAQTASAPVSASHTGVAEANAISEAQLRANRANALLSTGPRTREGRAIASLNAIKTGLTGRTVLMPYDDAAEYQQHMRAYEAELAPVGQREKDLVCSIAETAWRLKRIPWLEAGIFALGQIQVAGQFEEFDPELRPALIHAAITLQHERKLRNLYLQESRLVRRREKELAELRQLQADRQAQAEKENTAQAQNTAQEQNTVESIQPKPNEQPTAQPLAFAELVANGFEFFDSRRTDLLRPWHARPSWITERQWASIRRFRLCCSHSERECANMHARGCD